MSVARRPELGSKPVVLTVKLKPSKLMTQDTLSEGMQDLYRKGDFTDVVLLCAEQQFVAHRAVLASQSRFFKEAFLTQPTPPAGMRCEIRLEVANPESVKIMLDYLYMIDEKEWAIVHRLTRAINREVLQLARQFELPGLAEKAMRWLCEGLTTGNVVERLAICDEFGLSELSDKILQQLALNREALAEVANSPQIMSHPKLMQAILQSAESALPDSEPQPKKKA